MAPTAVLPEAATAWRSPEKKILIDCGLQQGRDEIDNGALPFQPGMIDYVLVTHAHIDHSGRLPLLIRQGFRGRILATRLTAQLMEIMLLDSAHIQESDAMWLNRKGQRAGKREVEPLYTVADAMQVKEYLYTCEYGEEVALCDGVKAVFTDAGHLLGSASITLTLTEGDVTKTIVFSGDIGNMRQPIIRDPVLLHRADYVVMESTYGDREHNEVPSYTEGLAAVIDETLGKGGNVVIFLCCGPHPGVVVFYPRNQRKGHGAFCAEFPCVYRQSAGPGGYGGLFRRSAGIS